MDWITASARAPWTPASNHQLQNNIWKVSPFHQVGHILHSIRYLLYSVMALLKSIFLTFIFTKKTGIFSLELLKAISFKYLKSIMVSFFLSPSYKIKIPFEFSDVQKEIEMNCYDPRISLFSEYSCHHCSVRKLVVQDSKPYYQIVPEVFGKWLFFENGTWEDTCLQSITAARYQKNKKYPFIVLNA